MSDRNLHPVMQAALAPHMPEAPPVAPRIDVSHNLGGYDDISTVYAYYTAEQKAEHGKHCEHWSCFSNHYPTHKEREFIATVEAERPGQFASYLISWSGCE